MSTSAQEETDPFAGVRELISRIEKVIGLIPKDFKNRDSFIGSLTSRMESVQYTAPAALDQRVAEIANTISHYLPEGTNPELEEQIGDIMCAPLPDYNGPATNQIKPSEKFKNSGNLLTLADLDTPDFKDRRFRILEIFPAQHHLFSGFVVVIAKFQDHPEDFKAFFFKRELLTNSRIQTVESCGERMFKFNPDSFKIEEVK